MYFAFLLPYLIFTFKIQVNSVLLQVSEFSASTISALDILEVNHLSHFIWVYIIEILYGRERAVFGKLVFFFISQLLDTSFQYGATLFHSAKLSSELWAQKGHHLGAGI